MIGAIIIMVLTLIAAIFDAREKRIPNYLIIVGLIIWIIWLIQGDYNLSDCIGGVLVPLFALFPFYMTKGLGAGDVKLLSVCGGFVGMSCLAEYLLVVLITSVVYGVVTALFKKKQILNQNLITMAVPIFFGTVIYGINTII